MTTCAYDARTSAIINRTRISSCSNTSRLCAYDARTSAIINRTRISSCSNTSWLRARTMHGHLQSSTERGFHRAVTHHDYVHTMHGHLQSSTENNTQSSTERGFHCAVIAKFHYTDQIGPARTHTDFVGDPHGPNGVSRRPGPQKSPCGSVRVQSGLCSGI